MQFEYKKLYCLQSECKKVSALLYHYSQDITNPDLTAIFLKLHTVLDRYPDELHTERVTIYQKYAISNAWKKLQSWWLFTVMAPHQKNNLTLQLRRSLDRIEFILALYHDIVLENILPNTTIQILMRQRETLLALFRKLEAIDRKKFIVVHNDLPHTNSPYLVRKV